MSRDNSTPESSEDAGKPKQLDPPSLLDALGVPAIDPDAAARHRPLLDALDVAVNGPEAAARRWYRLLTGDRYSRTPVNPHKEERVRQLLCRIYPDDPQRVEAELLAMRSKSFDDADAHCWGPNGRYFEEAMAAYCGLTPSQVKKMTWPEIAAELKAACQREGLLPPAQHVPADTASDKPAAEPQREGTAGGGIPPTDRFLDFTGKQQKLLIAMAGNGKVAIDDVLRAVYDSPSRKNLDALMKLKDRTNKALASKRPSLEIKKEGDTLRLQPV
jgi:hypothetical protein